MSEAAILVVDDDPGVRLILSTVLTASGHPVHTARDGAEALALLERERVDLVITDKHLPGMDGHTLIEAIWRHHPYVGAIMLTAYSSEESEALARQQQVLAYLEKPLKDLTVVPRIVQGALEVHRKRLGRP